ncbi:MAG: protein translocase subunit SecF [Alphaproteobacteria bacterium]|jgi:preprotein translocase subunit SecF|nr:protein translocase subunit SecF [Alphaproteobacteria bacterium]
MSLRIIPYNTKIDFVGFRFITFAISLIVILASTISFAVKGLNYGIDFRGGFIVEVHMPEKPDVPALRGKIEQLNLGEVSLQEFGKDNTLLIRLESHKEEGKEDTQVQAETLEKVKKVLGAGVDYRRVETLGAKVGGELIRNALKAIGFALMAMLIYIAIRFEWQFAACAIMALIHDCVAILGLFSLFPLEFNENAVIAILITAGYSINDTIVIFDRIRENIRKYKKMNLGELVNKSLNETLSRTILTASTTLLALTALYLWGGKVISTFTLPIIIGILIGSFSSICLAAPLLLYLRLKRGEEALKDTGAVLNR